MPTPKEFNLLKVIQKIELFPHLTMEEAQIVLSLSERKVYEPGKTVFRKGEIPHFFVIVISGQLRLSDVNSMKNETDYTTDPGECNGAINALTRRPHWFTVTAQRSSTVLSFDTLTLRTLISSNTALYCRILERALELAGNLIDVHGDFVLNQDR